MLLTIAVDHAFVTITRQIVSNSIATDYSLDILHFNFGSTCLDLILSLFSDAEFITIIRIELDWPLREQFGSQVTRYSC